MTITKTKPHVTQNTGNCEWHTPPYIIQAASAVLGPIELDPASSATANRIVHAKRFYAEDEDGLTQAWKAQTLWMNPPYTRSLVGRFVSKLIDTLDDGLVDRAIVLMNNTTETKAGQKLLTSRHLTAACFPAKRIRFLDSSGNEAKTPLQGQMILLLQSPSDSFYLNRMTTQIFITQFSEYGACFSK